MKLQGSEQKYARILRSIGHDLTELFPESLEIELSGNIYVARGRSKANARKFQAKDDEPGGLKHIWQKLSRPSSKPNDDSITPSAF